MNGEREREGGRADEMGVCCCGVDTGVQPFPDWCRAFRPTLSCWRATEELRWSAREGAWSGAEKRGWRGGGQERQKCRPIFLLKCL